MNRPVDERLADEPASWMGVLSLSLGIFSIATLQFLPTSLLPLIADDLDTTVGLAGQSMTATSAVAAVSALLVTRVVPRADRRRVILALTSIAVTSAILMALSSGFAMMVVARLLLGIALGGSWALGVTATASLVPRQRLGRALSVVNAGVPLATGLAVPLGALLGSAWGWRPVFGLAAGMAVVALLMQATRLRPIPPRPPRAPGSPRPDRRSAVLWIGLLATALIYAGHFAGFTYIRPIVEGASRVDAAGVSTLLLAFGLSSLAGTVLAGPLADRAPRLGLVAFPTIVGSGMLLLLAISGGPLGSIVAAGAIWGLGFGGVATSLQSWGARVAPYRLEQVGGLLVTSANVAVAIGAAVGGILIDAPRTTLLPLLAGIAPIVGGALVVSTLTRKER